MFKTNHFTTIWSIVKDTLKLYIFQLLRELDTPVMVNIQLYMCSRQCPHVGVCKVYKTGC